MERKELEEIHGKVWSTDEVTKEFQIISFNAPFCDVKEKSTGKRGLIEFQARPRFYFDFIEDDK